MTHSEYLYVQKLMNVRRQYDALRDTDEVRERWRQSNNEKEFMPSPESGDKKNWALVAFNTWQGTLAPAPSRRSGTRGSDLLSALNPAERYTIGKGGTLASLSLDGYETKVFVREDNLQPLNPVVSSIVPAHDEVVGGGKRTIVVGFSESMRFSSLSSSVFE